MALTRAQAKGAVAWEAFLAVKRSKRKDSPACVTCGAKASHEFRPGEPAYDCRHEPMRIDDVVMDRARETFRG